MIIVVVQIVSRKACYLQTRATRLLQVSDLLLHAVRISILLLFISLILHTHTHTNTERVEACLYNASYCNVLNLNQHVSTPPSSTPFSRFSAQYISSLYMSDSALSPTFLVDLPNFFTGLSVLDTLHLQRNGIVDLNFERINQLATSLAILDVSDNDLTTFEDICSSSPLNLQALYVNGNNISHYDNLDGCSRLVFIQLHDNDITSLSAYSLMSQSTGGSTYLNAVEYDGNLIETVDPDALRGNYPAFEILSFSKNRISSLDPTTFDDLVTLTGLWLDQNQLEEIPPNMFSNLVSLNVLDLAGQTSESLTLNAFSFNGLTDASLTLILSGGTFISKLPTDVFNGMSAPNIDLSTLGITEIEDYAFRGSSFENVRLSRNDVLKMSPLSFANATGSMTSNSCVDFNDWYVYVCLCLLPSYLEY